MIPERHELNQIEGGRERLVLAAARLLADADGTVLTDGLKKKTITELASQHPSNFGHHFESIHEVLKEVIDRFAQLGAQQQTADEILGQAFDSYEGDLPNIIRSISDGHYERTRGEGDRQLQLTLWALLHQSPEFRSDIVEVFAKPTTASTEALTSTLELWGMALRPPWDLHSLASVLRALADGLFLQSSVGNDVDELLGLTLLSMFPMLTHFAHEPARSVDEAMADITSRAASYWRDRNDEPVPDLRERVFSAVEVQLAHRGYNGLRLEDVAHEADVAPQQIAAGMGDLDRIICGCFRRRMAPTAGELEFDLRSGLFLCDELLWREMERLEGQAAQAPGLTRAIMAMMTGGGTPSAVAEELCTHLDAPIARLLDGAQDANELVSGVDPVMAARALLIGILLRVSLASGGKTTVPIDLVSPLFKPEHRHSPPTRYR